MTDVLTKGDYGVITEPATLKIERVLPGPIDRVWAYITDSDLRRQWMAAGEMELKVGAEFELVWRNAELNAKPSPRPEDFPEEHRLKSRIVELDAPRKLAIEWGSTGGVTFELKALGEAVLLTVTHRRVLDRSTLLNVSAGWHAHLDVLAARMDGEEPADFWRSWQRLKGEYEQRLGA